MVPYQPFSRPTFDQTIRHFLQALSGQIQQPARSAEELGKEIVGVYRKINPPRMYGWVTDLRQAAIYHVFGVERNLRYSESTFQLHTSLNMVAKSYRPFVIEFAKAMYGLLLDPEVVRKARHGVYYIPFVVVDAEGASWAVQQYSTPLFDGDLLVGNFNIYYRSEQPYRGEAIVPRPSISLEQHAFSTDYFRQEEAYLIEQVRHCLSGNYFFTPLQRRVMGKLLDNLSMRQMAGAFNPRDQQRGFENVRNHTKNILRKGKEYFEEVDFRTAREVAEFFSRLGLFDH